jgi:carbon monoxide dehydrogenase subunit G
MRHRGALLLSLVAVLAGGSGCAPEDVDWSAPENFLLREEASRTDEGVRLQYWSLVDAPADAVYAALVDVEHYPEFIPGVISVKLLESTADSKTVQIAQEVISRQTNARVKWTFDATARRIEFTTLQSNLARNDGAYEIEGSVDGARSLVRSTFLVRQGEHAQAVPIGVLASATREAFLKAAQGVKQRASARR